MKKITIPAIVGLCIYLVSSSAYSTLVGVGSLSLQITGNGPISAQYNYSNRLYGSVRDYDGASASVDAYLDQSTLRDQTIFRGSTLRGGFDTTTGAADFSYNVNVATPAPGNSSSGKVDLYGTTRFTGVLSDFAYMYQYNATKDNPSDTAQFIVQMEISFWDANSSSYLKVYSDYGTSSFALDLDPNMNFRTNWIFETDRSNATVALSGTNTFGDFSRYGSRNWSFRYDLQSVGVDTIGETNSQTVSEPASLILLGVGLAGIGLQRRKN